LKIIKEYYDVDDDDQRVGKNNKNVKKKRDKKRQKCDAEQYEENTEER
jgi:hypothetical protein